MDKQEFINVWADGSELSETGKRHMTEDLNNIMQAAEARAAAAEAERDNAQMYLDELTMQFNIVCQQRDEARRDAKAISMDFMNSLPTLWGDHVHDGKITVTLDAELVERIEAMP